MAESTRNPLQHQTAPAHQRVLNSKMPLINGANTDGFTSTIDRGRWLVNMMTSTASANISKLTRQDIIAGVALFFWLCSMVYVQQSHRSFENTDVIIHYFPAAQGVLEGQGIRAFEADIFRGPGYPFALASVTYLIGGDMFAASKLISVASSTLFLLFTYLFLRRVFDPTTALAAILLMMGVNAFAFVAVWSSTDVPFAFLVMASLYFSARSREPTWKDALLSGLLGGLALTVRWPGLLLPLFFFARVFLVPKEELGTRSKAQVVIIFLLGFFAASGPWLYANYQLHGSPLYTAGAIGNIDPDLLPQSFDPLQPLLQVIKLEPFGFGLRLLQKLFGSLPAVIQGLNSFPDPWGWVIAGPLWALIPFGVLTVLMRLDRLKLWFLIIAGIWWAFFAVIHFEARFYFVLLPTFSCLVVFIVTSGAWPDLCLEVGERRGLRLSAGYIPARIAGSRLPGWLISGRRGASLTSVALFGLLVVAALSAVKHVQGNYEWSADRRGFYHELANFVRGLQGAGLHRPIGTRQWSQARYWIPSEAGVPVLPLPGQDYASVLPDLSYILYDQISDEDILWDWWDDPLLSELADPLHAPSNLEAVYYKSDPHRAILYRILDKNDLAEIVTATPSTAVPEDPASQVFDNDAQTWWSSTLQTSANAIQSITLDLGGSTPINRIWLLPKPNGRAFPVDVHMEVSQDGRSWISVAEAMAITQPSQQNPQILSFSETLARYIRITATQLRWEEDSGGYLVSLAEIRVSNGLERPSESPMFSIGLDDVSFNPLSNELVAEVHNQTEVSGHASLELYEGWSMQDAKHLATVVSSVAEPGGVGLARVSLGESLRVEPGHCWPIWTALKPPSYWDLELDTYGLVRPLPLTTFHSVCSPSVMVVDDFEYMESPLERGWVAPQDVDPVGEVVTMYDPHLDTRVMRIRTNAAGGSVIFRWMKAYDRPEMTLQVRSSSDFIIYVQVRDLDGEYFYVQYMPFIWDTYSEEFPEGRYIYRPLGKHLVDGRWHRLEMDVNEDFAAKTGRVVDYIEAIAVRAYGEVEIADIELNFHK